MLGFFFFLMQKGVWPYNKHSHDVPLVTLILNIYIYIYMWVHGLTLTIQE